MTEERQAVSDKLKPCPFCGSPAKESFDASNNEHWVLCSNDSCDIQPAASSRILNDVREMWNTRDEREVAELREALEKVIGYGYVHQQSDLGKLIHAALKKDKS